jgi:hypothetical protein
MKNHRRSEESKMKKMILSRLTLLVFCIALMLSFASHATAQSASSGNVKNGIAKVKTFDGLAVIPYAGASLSRNNEAAFATISTSQLTPGTVVTLWWAIFNEPANCATPNCAPSDLNNPDVNGSLQFGGGQVVDSNGRADFSGYLAVGDNTGFHLLPQFPLMPNPAPGLVNPKGATIHLVIRTHGAASMDPAILNQQLTSFGGGCSVMPNPCANIQAALFVQ